MIANDRRTGTRAFPWRGLQTFCAQPLFEAKRALNRSSTDRFAPVFLGFPTGTAAKQNRTLRLPFQTSPKPLERGWDVATFAAPAASRARVKELEQNVVRGSRAELS
jgi:hypothetical protein